MRPPAPKAELLPAGRNFFKNLYLFAGKCDKIKEKSGGEIHEIYHLTSIGHCYTAAPIHPFYGDRLCEGSAGYGIHHFRF